MKVLVIHTLYKKRGGEDSVVDNEIALLKAEGLTVSLLTFNNTGRTWLKLLQLPFNYTSYLKTRRHIKSFNPDVVHLHNLHFSGSAAVIYAIKECKVPLVMTLHNYRILCPSGSLYYDNELFLDSLQAGFPWTAVKKGVYQNSRIITFWVSLSMYLHEKLKIWKAVDKFIMLGRHAKDLFEESRLGSLSDQMVIKPNFCYAAPFSGGHTRQTFYLFVGRLTEEKGVRILLEAFADNQLPLKIVGAGPLEDLVQDYCGRHTNISFMGQRTKHDINKLLQDSIALIFPSLWYETFGMVVIEAFSQGIPVIASHLGNLTSMVINEFNGLTFEKGNVSDLNKKISYYHNLSVSEKAAYAQNALNTYLKYYTPEDNAIQLRDIYSSAINRHSCRL